MKSATTTNDDQELMSRLTAARLERSRLADERAAREQRQGLLDQLEREELALKNEQAIAAAEAEHGPLGKRIAAVECTQGVVIVKRPNHVAFNRFQDVGKTTTVELEKLARPCVLAPDKQRFDAWCEDEPALLLRVANEVCALAGVRASEVSGK